MGRLRIIAFIEGVSFLLLLFLTMPLKYLYDMPMPNKVMGMLHGVLFLLYILAVFLVGSDFKWSFRKHFLALLAAIIPFGTFWADKKLFRTAD